MSSQVTVYEKGKERQVSSTASAREEIFKNFPDVLYYAAFFSPRELDKLYQNCPLSGKIVIANPHLTLAHVDNMETPYDGLFIEQFYERYIGLSVIGFCQDDDVVVALLDPETTPICQSNPPHITMYRERPVNLKDAAEKCIREPKKKVAANLKLRAQIRSWSTA